MRNAVIASVVSLLVGVGIGMAPTTSDNASPTNSPVAQASLTAEPTSEPTSEPTPEVTPEVTPEPTPEPTAVPVEPVLIAGSGSQNTAPFDMPSGDFTVVVKGSGDGNVIIDLVPRGDEFGENLFNEISNGTYTYNTVAYGVAQGSYYLDVVNDGAWTVTFTPLP